MVLLIYQQIVMKTKLILKGELDLCYVKTDIALENTNIQLLGIAFQYSALLTSLLAACLHVWSMLRCLSCSPPHHRCLPSSVLHCSVCDWH